jgi:hypothetical protein
VKLVATILAIFFFPASCFAQTCFDLASLGYDTISAGSQADSLAITQDDFCSEKFEENSSANSQRIKASYKVISGSYAKDATEIKTLQEKTCKSGYGLSIASAKVSTITKKVHDQTLAAITDCLTLQNSNLQSSFRTIGDATALVAQFKYLSKPALTFQKVEVVGPGKATCTAYVPDDKAGTVAIDGSKSFQIDTQNVTVICQREFEKDAGGKQFSDNLTIVFITPARSISIPMPAVRLQQVPMAEFAELREEVASAKTKLAEAAARRTSLVCESRSISKDNWAADTVLSAKDPDLIANGYNVVSGGCFVAYPPADTTSHRPTFRKTAMSDDKTGWDCMVGNQASLGRQYPLVSTATYCKAEVK